MPSKHHALGIWVYDWYGTLHVRHNGRPGVPNDQHLDCLFKLVFMRASTRTPKLRVAGICEGNPTVTGDFLSQSAGNTENVSIWWRHLELLTCLDCHWFHWQVIKYVDGIYVDFFIAAPFGGESTSDRTDRLQCESLTLNHCSLGMWL